MVRRELRSAIIGMVAGDAYIRKASRYAAQMYIAHAERQREYLVFKRDILQNLFRGYTLSVKAFDNNGYPGVNLSTRKHPKLRAIHKWFYPSGKKYFSRRILNYLTPLGLAIWYMDDGCMSYKKRDGKIHGREIILNTYVSYSETRTIQIYFKEVWNLEWRINSERRGHRLEMGTREAIKFFSIIRPYVIPSMNYKIDFRYEKPPRTRVIREALVNLEHSASPSEMMI